MGPARYSFLAHFLNTRLQPPQPLPTQELPVPPPKPDVAIPAPGEFRAVPESPYLREITVTTTDGTSQPVMVVTADALRQYADTLGGLRYVSAINFRALMFGFVNRCVPAFGMPDTDVPRWHGPGIYFLGTAKEPSEWGIVPERFAEIAYAQESNPDKYERAVERALVQRYINELYQPPGDETYAQASRDLP